MSATATLDAKGTRRDSETVDELRELAIARHETAQNIKAKLSRSTTLGDADYKAYEEAMSDKGLALAGITRYEDKLTYIRKQVGESMINDVLAKAGRIESYFIPAIRNAQINGWISKQRADWWLAKLLDKSTPFHKKHLFVFGKGEGDDPKNESEFRKFLNNWKTVAEEAKKLRAHPEIKNVTAKDVPQLSTFMDPKQFLNLSYKNREALLKTVSAAVAAKEKKMPELFTKAKAMLNAAVQRQALSPSKVGSWLERIFTSGAKAEQIEQFLGNGGPMPIQKLIQNWTEASTHFRAIENKRGELGTPRGFHFVSMEVFLNWGYDQRKAYLAEADHRFIDIRDEPYMFLRIRHALDCKDWEEADTLIADINDQIASGSLLMSKENKAKLQSMENYRKTHAPLSPQQAMPEDDPEAIVLQMREALAEISYPWIRDRFQRAMAHGYDTLWAYCTLNFNWEWCRKRGYSSDAIDEQFRERAKEETFDHLKHGQPKGHVNNDMTGNTSVTPAPRWDSDTNSAQAIHVDHTTSNTVLIDNFVHQNRHNRAVWYWTRLMEKDIPFTEVQYIIQNVQPVLKRGMRKLEHMGVRFTPSGPVAYKNSRALAYASAARPKMN